MVTDILDKNEQKEITVSEHNRAHRTAQGNVKQIKRTSGNKYLSE